MPEILIVDDEEPVRSTIRSILEFGGYEVREAASGEQALANLSAHRPDLVLCDVSMPQMTGHDVLRELRENYPRFSDLPFVFLSALAERGDIVDGLRMGADDYLAKPIDHTLLLAKIEATLRQVARMDEVHQQQTVKLYKALTQRNEPSAKPSAAAAPPAKPAGGAVPGGARSPDPLDGRLQRALDALSPQGSAGKLQFINLSEIRKRVGSRWQSLAPKIISVAENVIKRHINKDSVYQRYNDDMFFILFPNLKEEEAVVKVKCIADEISLKLLGEGEHSYRDLILNSAAVPMSEVVDGGKPTVEGMLQAFERRTQADGKQVKDLASGLLSDAVCKFQALWTPETERVIGYQVCCKLPSVEHLDPPEDDDPGGPGHPLIVGMDMMTAQSAVEQLGSRALLESGAIITLPLHFSALHSRNRQRLEDILSKAARRRVAGHLAIEMIPPEVAGDATEVFDALAYLRERCRFFILRCSPRHPRISQFVHEGTKLLSLGIHSRLAMREPFQLYKELRLFARDSLDLGLQPFVHGVSTLGGVNSAIQAGFRLIAGRAISSELDRPSTPFALSRNRFVL